MAQWSKKRSKKTKSKDKDKRKKRGPSGWTTPVQDVFLTSLIPAYRTTQAKNKKSTWKEFWANTQLAFIEQFPTEEGTVEGGTDSTIKKVFLTLYICAPKLK